MEFTPLEDMMEEVQFNTTAVCEYVGDIERVIRVIKEHWCAITSELHYKNCMSDQVIVHLLNFAVLGLNALPAGNGISSVYSPACHRAEVGLQKTLPCLLGFLWGSQ